jgi:hypothetical protein
MTTIFLAGRIVATSNIKKVFENVIEPYVHIGMDRCGLTPS